MDKYGTTTNPAWITVLFVQLMPDIQAVVNRALFLRDDINSIDTIIEELEAVL